MTNPLGEFKRKFSAEPSESAPLTTSRDYVAFQARDRVTRLRLRRAKGMTRAPNYDYLLDISIDEHRGDEITLHYSFMSVRILGKNLREIFDAIEMGTAHVIDEFDSSKWDKPKDSNKAFVESIKILAGAKMPPIAEEEGGRSVH